MKMMDALSLKAETKITHRQFGVCTVVEVMLSGGGFFGVVLNPDTHEGRELLFRYCGVEGSNVLEDSIRRIQLVDATT